MDFELMNKLAKEGKLDISKAFCKICYVNLIKKVEDGNGFMKIYYECPKCHQKTIITCDDNGNMIFSE